MDHADIDAPRLTGDWHDVGRSPDERVEALLTAMTTAEKAAQLGSVWETQNTGGGDVAPMESAMAASRRSFADSIAGGLGHLTRIFGSAPLSAADGVADLVRRQEQVMAANRFGIPAIAHEECLTGFTTFGATVYPTSLAWGASFDPELIHAMAAAIGSDMATVGIHQGLSPVLDVVRDARWGRVEETMGEDPYLVSVLGTAYVRGLQSAGVIATLKHFAGYAASRGARNHAPVSLGRREMADVVLPPFEMAVRLGEVGSVMNSYADVDGLPPAADAALLTGLLRDTWGFTGTVVADYWAVTFLETMHHVSASPRESALLALSAGLDVELPETGAYRTLPDAVSDGDIAESLLDAATRRVLRQKVDLGLLDPGWTPSGNTERDLDSEVNRCLARKIAEHSVVLLSNDGLLPLGASGTEPEGAGLGTIAVIGPGAEDARTMMGCYAFPNHVLTGTDDLGVPIDTLLGAVRAEFATRQVAHARGCEIDTDDTSGFAEAVDLAIQSDVVLLSVGDLAGLFGAGTSGEGCDRPDLALPGVQRDLAEAVLDSGTPVVLIVVSGRPYALGGLAERCAAVVQAFFPGVEGGSALAGVLSGRVNPSGRLPVGVPRDPGGQPATYRAAPLGLHTEGISSLDPTALFPFGHGLSYSQIEYAEIRTDRDDIAVDAELDVVVTVRNVGDRAATEVVQLYLSDLQAQVTRPVTELIGFHRVDLEPGQTRSVTFSVHADRMSFTGAGGVRVVEPGTVRLSTGASSGDLSRSVEVPITGELRQIEGPRTMDTPARVS